jgi:hypothetical protein
MPDFDAAERLRNKRLTRAAKARDAAVPPVWRRYLQGIRTLPVGHPGAAYLPLIRQAEAAYAVARGKAEDAYTRTIIDGRSL